MRCVSSTLTAFLYFVAIRPGLSGGFVHADKCLLKFRTIHGFALLRVSDFSSNDKAVWVTLSGGEILRRAKQFNVFPLGGKRVRFIIKHVQNVKRVGFSFWVTMTMLSHPSSLAQRRIADISDSAHLVFQAVNFVQHTKTLPRPVRGIAAPKSLSSFYFQRKPILLGNHLRITPQRDHS